jgi:predicted DsbA family dithiol-disulfide isomerase
MAVDKTLPNISEQPEETTEDLAVEMEEQLREQADTEVTELEDGGVEINFDPNAVAQGQETDFNANLADFVEEQQLEMLGSRLFENYLDYKNSRKDWERTYTEGH